MKISKQQQVETRQAIISAAVDRVIKKGFKAATMRAVARKAGIADATIYNYFPTKEAIVFAYYGDHMDACAEALKTVPDFNRFSLQEQLQTFYDTSLEGYLPDREFVQQTFKSAFFAFSRDFKDLKPIRRRFLDIVGDMVDAAMAADEIPEQVFLDVTSQLFWDHYIAMVIYWLGDTSDGFENTAVMIDKSLDLACTALSAGIANKVFDMVTFLFKNHVLGRMGFIQERVEALHAIKREFTGGRRERRHPTE